jgi:hypothetical protein
MDLIESLRILRRHWILTALMLVLALVGTATATLKLPRTYIASSSVVLLTSPNSSKANGNNPYLSFNGALNPTGDVVRYEVMDPRTAQVLASEGYSASYLVSDAVDTPGPVLDVTVTGSNKAVVDHTLSGVTTELSTKLEALQAGISPANRITMSTLAFGSAKLSKSKLARPLVVILGFGLVLAFAIPLIFDAQMRQRRVRSEAAAPPRRRTAAAPRDRLRVESSDRMRVESGDRMRSEGHAQPHADLSRFYDRRP